MQTKPVQLAAGSRGCWEPGTVWDARFLLALRPSLSAVKIPGRWPQSWRTCEPSDQGRLLGGGAIDRRHRLWLGAVWMGEEKQACESVCGVACAGHRWGRMRPGRRVRARTFLACSAGAWAVCISVVETKPCVVGRWPLPGRCHSPRPRQCEDSDVWTWGQLLPTEDHAARGRPRAADWLRALR